MYCAPTSTCNGGGWVLYGAILRGDSMWTEWLDQLQVPFFSQGSIFGVWVIRGGKPWFMEREFPFPQLGWSLGLVPSWAFSGETLRAALDTSKLIRFCYWEHWCRKIATEQMPKTEWEREREKEMPKTGHHCLSHESIGCLPLGAIEPQKQHLFGLHSQFWRINPAKVQKFCGLHTHQNSNEMDKPSKNTHAHATVGWFIKTIFLLILGIGYGKNGQNPLFHDKNDGVRWCPVEFSLKPIRWPEDFSIDNHD